MEFFARTSRPSEEAMVDCDVAGEVIAEFISLVTAQIFVEAQSHSPDPAVMRGMTGMRNRAVLDQRRLSAHAPAKSSSLQRRYGEMIRRMHDEINSKHA
jgi:hypothetical protein